MNFSERIEAVMRHYGLQARELADKCGVQRTAINHLLNGRNRPSVGFLSALSDSFPELNTRWLLHGNGPMFTNVSERLNEPSHGTQKTNDTNVPVPENAVIEDVQSISKLPSKEEPIETKVVTPVTSQISAHANERRIVQVIVCYNDGTCSSYRYQE